MKREESGDVRDGAAFRLLQGIVHLITSSTRQIRHFLTGGGPCSAPQNRNKRTSYGKCVGTREITLGQVTKDMSGKWLNVWLFLNLATLFYTLGKHG